MKQFDLQAALNGAPVVTRNGDRVEQIFHAYALRTADNVVCIVGGVEYHFYENGKYLQDTDNQHDLFMAPTERVFYQNIYRSLSGTYCGSALFESEAEALKYDSGGRVAAVKIEFED